MATLTLRVEDSVKHALDHYAAARGITVTDVLRPLVDQVLGRDTADPDYQTVRAAALSDLDRLRIAMQHETLALLVADDWEKKHHEQRARVFREGLTLEYEDEFHTLYPELSRADCRLTRDVLNMFDSLKASLSRLSAADRAALTDQEVGFLTFDGFDGNDSLEGRMGGYVDYLLGQDRWQTLKPDWEAADRGNSHFPVLAGYRRQLEVFEPMWAAIMKDFTYGKSLLTLDQLRQVAAARVHPDRRP